MSSSVTLNVFGKVHSFRCPDSEAEALLGQAANRLQTELDSQTKVQTGGSKTPSNEAQEGILITVALRLATVLVDIEASREDQKEHQQGKIDELSRKIANVLSDPDSDP